MSAEGDLDTAASVGDDDDDADTNTPGLGNDIDVSTRI